MEWVETTADSIESARIKALDLLNVEAADAEIEVIEDVKKGLFGRVKTEARVRARIRPKAPAPKDDRRNRRSGGGRGRGDKNSGGRNSGGKGGGRNQGGRSSSKDGGRSGGNRDGGNRDGNRDGGRSGGNRDGNRDGGRSGGNRDGGNRDGGNRDGGRSGGNRDGGRNSGRTKAAAGAAGAAVAGGAAAAAATGSSDDRQQGEDESNNQNSNNSSSTSGENKQSNKQRDQGRDRNRQEPAVTEEFSVSDQQAVMNEFVSGVAAVFDQDAQVEVVDMGDDVLEAQVAGEDLGLLVGPSGATLAALEELTRTAMQRAAGGRRYHRIHVDVDGYKERRREALGRFARQLAEDVVDSGDQKALEPMNAADRKVVHDALSDFDGVSTLSEGDDPRRYVVIAPE